MSTRADLVMVMLEGRYGDNEIISSSSDEEFPKRMDQMKDAKPPLHRPAIRHCASTARLVDSSLQDLDLISPSLPHAVGDQSGFLPVIRSGSCSEIGRKTYMEDEHICMDNIVGHLGAGVDLPAPGAFYGVFDGHDGLDAASFVRNNLLRFIIEDHNFPTSMEKAMNSAFETTDHAFSDSPSLDSSSGTTVLAALILGRTLLIANAGDCRAVLGRRGRAIELSRDHKPNSKFERLRIEKLGGIVCDGYLNYLNGQLSVSRALGDWHMKGPKGSASPLSAEPELQETILTEEDEFLIMGCDGLWDVMSSQYAVTIVRRELMAHNDPEQCSRELVQQALKMDACDNLTVVVICFSSSPPPRIEIPKSRVRRSISLEGLFLLKGVLDGND